MKKNLYKKLLILLPLTTIGASLPIVTSCSKEGSITLVSSKETVIGQSGYANYTFKYDGSIPSDKNLHVEISYPNKNDDGDTLQLLDSDITIEEPGEFELQVAFEKEPIVKSTTEFLFTFTFNSSKEKPIRIISDTCSVTYEFNEGGDFELGCSSILQVNNETKKAEFTFNLNEEAPSIAVAYISIPKALGGENVQIENTFPGDEAQIKIQNRTIKLNVNFIDSGETQAHTFGIHIRYRWPDVNNSWFEEEIDKLCLCPQNNLNKISFTPLEDSHFNYDGGKTLEWKSQELTSITTRIVGYNDLFFGNGKKEIVDKIDQNNLSCSHLIKFFDINKLKDTTFWLEFKYSTNNETKYEGVLVELLKPNYIFVLDRKKTIEINTITHSGRFVFKWVSNILPKSKTVNLTIKNPSQDIVFKNNGEHQIDVTNIDGQLEYGATIKLVNPSRTPITFTMVMQFSLPNPNGDNDEIFTETCDITVVTSNNYFALSDTEPVIQENDKTDQITLSWVAGSGWPTTANLSLNNNYDDICFENGETTNEVELDENGMAQFAIKLKNPQVFDKIYEGELKITFANSNGGTETQTILLSVYAKPSFVKATDDPFYVVNGDGDARLSFVWDNNNLPDDQKIVLTIPDDSSAVFLDGTKIANIELKEKDVKLFDILLNQEESVKISFTFIYKERKSMRQIEYSNFKSFSDVKLSDLLEKSGHGWDTDLPVDMYEWPYWAFDDLLSLFWKLNSILPDKDRETGEPTIYLYNNVYDLSPHKLEVKKGMTEYMFTIFGSGVGETTTRMDIRAEFSVFGKKFELNGYVIVEAHH